jgi:hypothetical protein
MRKLIPLAAAFLAACSNQIPSESSETVTPSQPAASGIGSVDASIDRLNSLNAAIAWLETKNSEDPVRMSELISQCSRETGARMEGEGAVRITSCVQARWQANPPVYANTPDYVPPADHPKMTRDEQIRTLKREDPSSYGYTDSDRKFLREHGVSEAEARAIEETLARQGFND